MSTWLQGSLLPVETVPFLSDVACIGAFRCPAGDPLFRDSGPIRNMLFAFPRRAVAIRHEEQKTAFVGDPNVITLYNRGQVYSRQAIDAADESDWYGVAPDVILDVARRYDERAEEAADRPFAAPFVASPLPLFLQQRRLFDGVMAGTVDSAAVDETILAMLDQVFRLMPGRRRPKRGHVRDPLPRIEHVRNLLARSLDRPLSLRALGAAAGLSVYHLCRVFHRETGFAVHEYRQQLRLRRALDEVLSSKDLLATALELGFNSHSHFAYAFRRTFGVTPSELRRRGRTVPRGA
jgi:AraC family transcriptional regulator